MKRSGALAAVVVAAGVVSAILGAAAADSATTTLTIYSGREERLVKPLFDRFTRNTGIALEVRYASSAQLAATILEEGSNSPADVFFSQESGVLGLVAREGMLKVLPASTLAMVPPRFRAPGKRWVGTSGRARVIAYNTNELTRGQLPASTWDLTKPAWKGRIGIAPTNASFQAFVTAMRLSAGEARTK